jgi:hypothetical protein
MRLILYSAFCSHRQAKLGALGARANQCPATQLRPGGFVGSDCLVVAEELQVDALMCRKILPAPLLQHFSYDSAFRGSYSACSSPAMFLSWRHLGDEEREILARMDLFV